MADGGYGAGVNTSPAVGDVGSAREKSDLEMDRLGDRMRADNPALSEGWKDVIWHRPPLSNVDTDAEDPNVIRVFLNGCFDLMHVGHFNALRQAKRSFYEQGFKRVVLVAGIHSDVAIVGQKGPPLCLDDERIEIVKAVKWVDEIVTFLPYESMSLQLADALKVKFICHGDDLPVVKGGTGMYSEVINCDRFQVLKRTEGISTTNIIERLLRQSEEAGQVNLFSDDLGSLLTTVERLSHFALPPDPWRQRRQVSDAKRIVYVDGTFDLLHVGHVRMLEMASKLGDYLLVGLFSDETVRTSCNKETVLNLHERALAVLSLGVVDDVVLGTPRRVTQDLLTSLNISLVCSGLRDSGSSAHSQDKVKRGYYDLPISRKIIHHLDSGTNITNRSYAERFLSQRSTFKARNNKLWQKEQNYTEGKAYVPER